MEWQPIVTLVAAIIAAASSSFALFRLQYRKKNDDIDLTAFQHSLDKKLKEFESTLALTNSYLTEKGKNSATKEDVLEITAKIESVRIAYEKDADLWRHGLSKRATLYKLQAAKEFQVYEKLWTSLTDLRLNFEDFRPSFDPRPPGTNFTELRHEQKGAVANTVNLLTVDMDLNRPFIPEHIYSAIRDLVNIAKEDVLHFEGSFATTGEITFEGRRVGKANFDRFLVTLNSVCDLIRNRLIQP